MANRTQTKSKKNQFKYLVILILLVGALLRIYNLSSENVSFDEANALQFTENPSSDFGHPPFYFLFLNYWIKLFGDGEFSIRAPSVIFGILSILLLYFLADLLFDKNIALLSIFIFSINPFHIYLSQQARMYPLFILFSLLSLFYFFKVLKEEKKINWWFYIIFNLLNLYTHYFAVFVLFIEILYFILFCRNLKFKLRDFILTNLLILILFSSQFLKIYNGFLSKTSGFNWGLKSSEYFTSIFNSFLGWDILFTLIVFLLFLFGLLKIDKKINFFGFIYVLFPLIVGFFLSFEIPIIPRHFIFILPIYIMFISKGLINIKYKWIQMFLVVFIFLISGFKLADDYSNSNNPQWEESVDYIENKKQKEDVILIDYYAKGPIDYYYKGNLTRIDLLSSVDVNENKKIYDDIKSKLKTNRVWLILSDDFRTGKYYKYRLEQDLKLIDSKRFVGISVYLYGN